MPSVSVPSPSKSKVRGCPAVTVLTVFDANPPPASHGLTIDPNVFLTSSYTFACSSGGKPSTNKPSCSTVKLFKDDSINLVTNCSKLSPPNKHSITPAIKDLKPQTPKNENRSDFENPSCLSPKKPRTPLL